MFVTRLFLRCRSSLCARNLNYRPWTCILSFLAWFACLNLNVRNPVFNAFTPQALFSPARVRLKRHSWQFCRKSSCAVVQQGGQKKRVKLRNSTPADDAERREADAAEERGRVHASDRAAEGAPARRRRRPVGARRPGRRRLPSTRPTCGPSRCR
jgi:hypothetical protein